MAGRLIDGVEYVKLTNDNSLKSKSLEDNVYFTLRDIFSNADINEIWPTSYFNGILTNDVSFEERDENFKYSNVLNDHNLKFTQDLFNWIHRITCNGIRSKLNLIEFYESEKDEMDEEIDMSKYMKYDDWYEQFLDLRKKLQEQLEKHKKMKTTDGL